MPPKTALRKAGAHGPDRRPAQGIARCAGGARAADRRRDRAGGLSPPRIRDRGYETLLRTIVGQQVSVAAAQSIWNKMAAQLGALTDPGNIARASDEDLRAAGLSRQKIAYARSLAEEVTSGRLDFAHLAEDDEEAIAQLVRIKGIGRWSAEIYLLFAEGAPISGPPETWRCRSRSAGSWATPNGRARS